MLGSLILDCGNTGIEPGEPPRREYTQDQPGIWEQLAGSHVPGVVVSGSQPSRVNITVPFNGGSSRHYIEKIGILDRNGREINAKSFPVNIQSRSSLYKADFEVTGDVSTMKAFVRCSQHDVWTAPILP